jgi:hypothetical protein
MPIFLAIAAVCVVAAVFAPLVFSVFQRAP